MGPQRRRGRCSDATSGDERERGGERERGDEQTSSVSRALPNCSRPFLASAVAVAFAVVIVIVAFPSEPRPRPVVEPSGWQQWHNDDFRSPNVLRINTSNFNASITDLRRNRGQLLVAFYDRRSISFKELRLELENTADALARFGGAAAPIGTLGACDVGLDTFLSRREAPQMMHGWQRGTNDGKMSFKFHEPRYFPLILMFYQDGIGMGEYTGVVKVAAIIEFLHRHKVAVRGGVELDSDASLQSFLTAPGPFALSCGLVNGTTESSAFSDAAEMLFTTVLFGRLSDSLCGGGFGMTLARPHVFWLRHGASGLTLNLSTSDADVLGSGRFLADWLESHRKELAEMTPDNSHVYLDDLSPLVVYLVDSTDKVARARGERLFGTAAEVLEAANVSDFRFVWSDCRIVGAEFIEDPKSQCPVVLLVNPTDLSWDTIGMSALLKPRRDSAKNASDRLVAWLLKQSQPWRVPRERGNISDRNVGNDADVSDDHGVSEHVVDGKKAIDRSLDYEEMFPDLNTSGMRLPHVSVFIKYHAALSHLTLMRQSFEAKYGSAGLNFDFFEVREAQALHPEFELLAESAEALMIVVKDESALRDLWAKIQKRNEFSSSLSNNADTDFVDLALKGYRLLRACYRRFYAFMHERANANSGGLGVPVATPREVERRQASGLSVREFFDRYARPGNPVIITGLNVSKEPWTLDYLRRRCNATIDLVTRNASATSWGQLQHAGKLPLAEFIDTFTHHAARRSWYLHDWGLPSGCPELFGPPPYEEFTVPRYFVGDYFQRHNFGGYQHSWPSLFVGSNQTLSSLHIDSAGTNFWLYLLSGTKEWRFYSRREFVNTYKDPLGQHFHIDVFEPNVERFPLLKYAELNRGIQQPGDLIFIPAGSPHGVRNIEHIHGISMNYVDASNFGIFLWHMLDDVDWRTVEAFTDTTVRMPLGIRSQQKPMPFGEWKSTDWHKLTYDLQ